MAFEFASYDYDDKSYNWNLISNHRPNDFLLILCTCCCFELASASLGDSAVPFSASDDDGIVDESEAEGYMAGPGSSRVRPV